VDGVPHLDDVTESKDEHRGETTMEYYAGIDVSLECPSVCLVDANGKIIRERKAASEPEALIGWFAALGLELAR
jgi:transposase